MMLVFIVFGCGGGLNMNSYWKNHPITIDGIDKDWGDSLALMEKEKVAIGISNDSDYLYLCLKFLDRSNQMQAMRGGLTLWFDSTGSDHKYFGIHYPVGMAGREMSTPFGEQGDSDRARTMRESFYEMLHDVEVVGQDNTIIEKFSNLHASGFEVAVSDSTGPLIYELKIPLAKNGESNYAVASRPGGTIGIGLETGQFRRTARRPEGSGDDGGGGMGGGRRGGGGRMGGRRGGFGGGRQGGGDQPASPPEPLNVWAKVTLAPAR